MSFETKDVVVSLEGFNDPLDTADMVIGKDQITFVNQNDPDFQMETASLEDAISNARKTKRVILAPSTEEGFFAVSCEAIAAMVNGTAEDMIIINDARNGFNYADLPAGKELIRQMNSYVTVVDNIHEAKALL